MSQCGQDRTTRGVIFQIYDLPVGTTITKVDDDSWHMGEDEEHCPVCRRPSSGFVTLGQGRRWVCLDCADDIEGVRRRSR